MSVFPEEKHSVPVSAAIETVMAALPFLTLLPYTEYPSESAVAAILLPCALFVISVQSIYWERRERRKTLEILSLEERLDILEKAVNREDETVRTRVLRRSEEACAVNNIIRRHSAVEGK